MSYCGGCYYEGKKLKPCLTCYCGSEAKTEWTNADRIRSMSDEELAKERIDRIDAYTKSDLKEFIGDFAGIVNSEEEAIKKELEWLQSEVE